METKLCPQCDSDKIKLLKVIRREGKPPCKQMYCKECESIFEVKTENET